MHVWDGAGMCSICEFLKKPHFPFWFGGCFRPIIGIYCVYLLMWPGKPSTFVIERSFFFLSSPEPLDFHVNRMFDDFEMDFMESTEFCVLCTNAPSYRSCMNIPFFFSIVCLVWTGCEARLKIVEKNKFGKWCLKHRWLHLHTHMWLVAAYLPKTMNCRSEWKSLFKYCHLNGSSQHH